MQEESVTTRRSLENKKKRLNIDGKIRPGIIVGYHNVRPTVQHVSGIYPIAGNILDVETASQQLSYVHVFSCKVSNDSKMHSTTSNQLICYQELYSQG